MTVPPKNKECFLSHRFEDLRPCTSLSLWRSSEANQPIIQKTEHEKRNILMTRPQENTCLKILKKCRIPGSLTYLCRCGCLTASQVDKQCIAGHIFKVENSKLEKSRLKTWNGTTHPARQAESWAGQLDSAHAVRESRRSHGKT